MHFLPDIFVTCEVCGGRRYDRETLQVRYKGLTIAEVLDLTVEQAREVFEHIPPVERILSTLDDARKPDAVTLRSSPRRRSPVARTADCHHIQRI